jgi:hypothetical protein
MEITSQPNRLTKRYGKALSCCGCIGLGNSSADFTAHGALYISSESSTHCRPRSAHQATLFFSKPLEDTERVPQSDESVWSRVSLANVKAAAVRPIGLWILVVSSAAGLMLVSAG